MFNRSMGLIREAAELCHEIGRFPAELEMVESAKEKANLIISTRNLAARIRDKLAEVVRLGGMDV